MIALTFPALLPTGGLPRGAADTAAFVFPAAHALRARTALPDPFLGPDGQRLTSPAQWPRQRTYLKAMLAHYQYGHMPPKPKRFQIEPVSQRSLFGDSVVETCFRVILRRNGKQAVFRAGLRRPRRPGRFPVIIKNDSFLFDLQEVGDPGRRDKYARLGRDRIVADVTREALKRGYVFCKFNRNEVAADNDQFQTSGVFPLYPEYDWGTIAAWAWAYQILIDHLEQQPYIDAQRIVATGHSRGGKAALCAGVYEDRIAVTAPNSSGSGGTGSWNHFDPDQRKQVLAHHQTNFPHWWTSCLFDFVGRSERMPFDAHFPKALIAPRGLINPHSRDDAWANPYGTYLTALAADVVYAWLGVPEHQGVHWRNGPHNQNREDWLALFAFCDRYFFGRPSDLDFKANPRPDTYRFERRVPFTAP